MDFLTGQFITVYWPHKQKYKRAYSLSSCALDRGYYEVTVKREGKMGTSIVDWAEEGDDAMMSRTIERSERRLAGDRNSGFIGRI